MTQRFAGFRLVFAVVALALWAGDAANAQVERTPTAENVVRNVKRTPSPDANPVVAPRRVSEAPVAASRGGARAARVGGTGGDSARSVDNGRISAEQETMVSNTICGAVTVNANDLACCLKTCREGLHVCAVGDQVSCTADARTPIQCFKEFKCCLDACFPECEPSNCGGGCTPNPDDECTTDPALCCPPLQCCHDENDNTLGKCCTDGTCDDVGESCEKDINCCFGLQCCLGSCIPNDDCCVDSDCTDEINKPNCCGGTCQEDKCCVVGDCDSDEVCCDEKCSDCACDSDTCFAKDVGDGVPENLMDYSCCFPEKNSGATCIDPPVQSPDDEFQRWGWTNGPYDLVQDFDRTLKVYCGTAQCVLPTDNPPKGFQSGTFTIKYRKNEKILTAQWISEGTSDWQMHLGCSNDDPVPGVYPYKLQPGKYFVAPGQYALGGTGDTAETFAVPDGCNKLWVIVHFCATESE